MGFGEPINSKDVDLGVCYGLWGVFKGPVINESSKDMGRKKMQNFTPRRKEK